MTYRGAAKTGAEVGSEIQKTWPCVIPSPPEMHDYLRTAIVALMTTGSRPAPYRVAVLFDGTKGLLLLDQIRTVDRNRLLRRLGMVDSTTLRAALTGLGAMFAE